MMPLPVIAEPFDRIAMDIVGPRPIGAELDTATYLLYVITLHDTRIQSQGD